jgi:hypothetical protein
MAWQNEMVRIVRHLINDLDSSNYTFTDDRLEESALVSAQLLLKEVDFDNTYTIDTDALDMSPDPTTLATKDDAFINLVCLKSACIILGSEVRTNSLNAIVVKDGPSSIDMRGIAAGLHNIYKDMCAKYDHYVMQWQAGNSVAGQAILSPYSPASDNVSRSSLTHRSGNFD